MNIYLPDDLLEAVKQYILVVRLSEHQEIGLSEALIRLCRTGLQITFDAKDTSKNTEITEITEEYNSSKTVNIIGEESHKKVYMTEEEAYKKVKERGHNISIESFRQNYARYSFSRTGSQYTLKRKRNDYGRN
jgi:hypothetical protein